VVVLDEMKLSLTARKGTATQYMEDSMSHRVWTDMPKLWIMPERVWVMRMERVAAAGCV
jgi:hypothetical protein